MSGQWDDLLRQDHEITERVFAAMEVRFASVAGPPPAQVMRLVRYLDGYVDRCHNQKEEQHLFPRLERGKSGSRHPREMYYSLHVYLKQEQPFRHHRS